MHTAFSLFLLRGLSFSHFSFPRWQALVAITLIGLLAGLDPGMRQAMPLWLAILHAVLSVWASFLIVLGILPWWLKRGERWDGQGDLFNLVSASWLVSDFLAAGFVAAGIPALIALPLWLYSIWVGGNALSGAIPKASLGYCIGGILVSLIPSSIVSILIMSLIGFVMTLMGITPPPSPGAGPAGMG